MSWLDNVQAGDQVVVRCHWPTEIAELHTVSKVNKTQIVLDDDQRFSKNGRLWGGNSWHPTYLEQSTPAALREMEEVNRQKRIRRLRQAIADRLKTTTLDELDKIAEVLGIFL